MAPHFHRNVIKLSHHCSEKRSGARTQQAGEYLDKLQEPQNVINTLAIINLISSVRRRDLVKFLEGRKRQTKCRKSPYQIITDI